MGQAIVDPQELRNFASKLRTRSGELRSIEQALKAALRELNQTWRDEQYQKFAGSFEEFCKPLARFLEGADRYVEHLKTQAATVEEYQRTGGHI